jgi:hypothetical protein
LFDVAVPVDTAAFKKAVVHHALAQEKKYDCQSDKKQELSNSKPARPFSCGGSFIRVRCQVSYLSAMSGACHGIATELLTMMPEIA